MSETGGIFMKKSLVAVVLFGVFLLAACVHTDEQSQKTTTLTAITVAEGAETSQGTTTVGITSTETEAAVTTVAPETPTTETTTTAPPEIRKKLLSVTPQIQEKWYFCAPTTVSMMLSTQGIIVSQEQLAKEMGTYEPYATHNREEIRVLNQHLFGYPEPQAGQAGYRLATVTNASPDSEDMRLFKERVRKSIDDGYPLYYTFTISQIYPGKSGEHNVIGIGYELTPDGKDISAIYYLDSMTHVQDPTYGGLKKVTPKELLAAMVTCGEPNYAW